MKLKLQRILCFSLLLFLLFPSISIHAADSAPLFNSITLSEKTEPPYPFWKDYKNYSQNTKVYYIGKIYENKWYANAGQKPNTGDPWVLLGDAEWTVPEDEKNYQKEESSASINKILTDAEILSLYGGINPEYSPEKALNRLNQLIQESSYNELFPYRFGSIYGKTVLQLHSTIQILLIF